jgi:hypothetical protein
MFKHRHFAPPHVSTIVFPHQPADRIAFDREASIKLFFLASR